MPPASRGLATDAVDPPRPVPVTRLLTVGHGTASTPELRSTLRGADVDAVIDIRRFPGSRAHPHLGRDELAGSLPAAGVSYRWEPRLGGRRRLAKQTTSPTVGGLSRRSGLTRRTPARRSSPRRWVRCSTTGGRGRRSCAARRCGGAVTAVWSPMLSCSAVAPRCGTCCRRRRSDRTSRRPGRGPWVTACSSGTARRDEPGALAACVGAPQPSTVAIAVSRARPTSGILVCRPSLTSTRPPTTTVVTSATVAANSTWASGSPDRPGGPWRVEADCHEVCECAAGQTAGVPAQGCGAVARECRRELIDPVVPAPSGSQALVERDRTCLLPQVDPRPVRRQRGDRRAWCRWTFAVLTVLLRVRSRRRRVCRGDCRGFSVSAGRRGTWL